jgi:hypothetical protein
LSLHQFIYFFFTIFSQLKQKKQFTAGALYKTLVQDVHGQLSLEDYEKLSEKDKQIEELHRCGLTKEELELKLSSQVYEFQVRLG